MGWLVQKYNLYSGHTGKKIRTATQVISPSGQKFNLLDKMSKKVALKQVKGGHTLERFVR